ncbi:ABC transporter permease [Maritimibacter alkaliphilus]|uniref:ABC transporter permease n=1 Tax=Maritimibacter alkaliphilus TaxID=404236 RepID=UPI001C95D6E0|nr:ABC transporter permease [Maritimibacter alkaliphilus]MBY6090470.1 ABC transporter permease [Maritimibacter alkaliphilus]
MTRRINLGNLALSVFSILILLILIAPILIIFMVSFTPTEMLHFPPPGFSLRWYEAYFSDPKWMTATRVSFVVAALTAVFSLVIGFAISVALVRYRFFGKAGLRMLVMSPMILPKIIIAVGLYFLYVKLRILGTTGALVMAHSIIAIPYVVMIITASLYSFDRRLEWAARSLGASPLRAVWLITIPNLKPAILGGGLFAFVASFDDIILSLFLTKLTEPTLPRQIWVNVQQTIDPTIAAVSTFMTVVSVLGLWLVALAQRGLKKG